MIHSRDIWEVIQARMLRERWVSLEELYKVVEEYGNLDSDDFKPQSPTSDIPSGNEMCVMFFNTERVQVKFYGIERQGICYPKPYEGS